MLLSAPHQIVLLFSLAVCVIPLIPRLLSAGGNIKAQPPPRSEHRFRSGPHPGPHPGPLPGPGLTPPERVGVDSVQQVQRMMEQEMRKEKAKSSSGNKGYVFTLMPLYAVGVGLFAAYKFLKIKSADESRAQKEQTAQGLRKSEETENQLNELEQRLAQTEKMLNSILTQLDPLTNCVKSVAMEQKNEIMNQLQCIRHLMKKRGMKCQPTERMCERNLDDLIESLSTMETGAVAHTAGVIEGLEEVEEEDHAHMPALEEEDEREVTAGGVALEDTEGDGSGDELEEEEVGVSGACPDELGAGLRRRTRPD
ncbi:coiled-coil domain-containing protein 107 [Trichomycterus rosablanca]|uniref:coiled-coil domain-containing protein 107 n=1 Tax=Trichomycterus rosablanca TaxID=2290929 RepID=UPI002F357AA3